MSDDSLNDFLQNEGSITKIVKIWNYDNELATSFDIFVNESSLSSIQEEGSFKFKKGPSTKVFNFAPDNIKPEYVNQSISEMSEYKNASKFKGYTSVSDFTIIENNKSDVFMDKDSCDISSSNPLNTSTLYF